MQKTFGGNTHYNNIRDMARFIFICNKIYISHIIVSLFNI